MTFDIIQRLARERAIQDIEAMLWRPAELTLEEARTFRPSGAEGLAGVSDRETATETAR